MRRIIPVLFGAFILIGSLLSCESNAPNNSDCDTCQNPCDTCIPCDTCDTTLPCDTCDTTDPTPNPNDTTSHDFTWTEYSIPGEVNLTGAWVFNEKLIYAMGDRLWRWDGVKWEREKVIIRNTQREAGFADGTMFAISPTDMWFINGWVYHYHSGFADELAPNAPGVIACWGLSSDDMFFVGKSGSLQHFDGETFTKFPQVTTKNLRSVWGTSHNDVWAAGFNSSTGEIALLHYDGVSWTEVDVKTVGWIGVGKHALMSVWATDSSGHKITIAAGSNIWRKTDNGSWRSDSAFLPNALPGGGFVGLGVRGNNANDLLAAGGWGWVGHWNGKTWKRYDELFNYGNPNYGAAALHIKGNTACVGGTKSGQSWIAIGRRKP